MPSSGLRTPGVSSQLSFAGSSQEEEDADRKSGGFVMRSIPLSSGKKKKNKTPQNRPGTQSSARRSTTKKRLKRTGKEKNLIIPGLSFTKQAPQQPTSEKKVTKARPKPQKATPGRHPPKAKSTPHGKTSAQPKDLLSSQESDLSVGVSAKKNKSKKRRRYQINIDSDSESTTGISSQHNGKDKSGSAPLNSLPTKSLSKKPSAKKRKTEKKKEHVTMDVDDDDNESMEVPYALNLGDNTADVLKSSLSDKRTEPLRPGDVIFYYHPVFVAGNPDGIRVTQVVSTDPNARFPLELDNGEFLPPDTRIKRIREYDKGKVYEHPGIFRDIGNFRFGKRTLDAQGRKMLKGEREQVERALNQVMKQAEEALSRVPPWGESHDSSSDEEEQVPPGDVSFSGSDISLDLEAKLPPKKPKQPLPPVCESDSDDSSAEILSGPQTKAGKDYQLHSATDRRTNSRKSIRESNKNTKLFARRRSDSDRSSDNGNRFTRRPRAKPSKRKPMGTNATSIALLDDASSQEEFANGNNKLSKNSHSSLGAAQHEEEEELSLTDDPYYKKAVSPSTRDSSAFSLGRFNSRQRKKTVSCQSKGCSTVPRNLSGETRQPARNPLRTSASVDDSYSIDGASTTRPVEAVLSVATEYNLDDDSSDDDDDDDLLSPTVFSKHFTADEQKTHKDTARYLPFDPSNVCHSPTLHNRALEEDRTLQGKPSSGKRGSFGSMGSLKEKREKEQADTLWSGDDSDVESSALSTTSFSQRKERVDTSIIKKRPPRSKASMATHRTQQSAFCPTGLEPKQSQSYGCDNSSDESEDGAIYGRQRIAKSYRDRQPVDNITNFSQSSTESSSLQQNTKHMSGHRDRKGGPMRLNFQDTRRSGNKWLSSK